MKNTIYAGTYTGSGSKGIYRLEMEDGVLSEPSLFCEMKNPKYIAEAGNEIVATGDFQNGSGVVLISKEGEILDTECYESGTSCYVTEKDGIIYTANYHAGTFSAIAREDNRLRLMETVHIREKAGCHQVLLWNDRILVPCLMLDRVMIYDRSFKRLGSIHFNQGTGPRHGVFSKDGEYLYLVSELSNELFVIKTGTWEVLYTTTILPDGQKNQRDTAAIRLSDDEKHLYVSTRTKDIISVLVIEDHMPQLVQTIDCGGRHPRDFILADGYLLSANRFSNTIASLPIREDGTLGQPVSFASVPEAVSLIVKD